MTLLTSLKNDQLSILNRFCKLEFIIFLGELFSLFCPKAYQQNKRDNNNAG